MVVQFLLKNRPIALKLSSLIKLPLSVLPSSLVSVPKNPQKSQIFCPVQHMPLIFPVVKYRYEFQVYLQEGFNMKVVVAVLREV